MRVLQGVQLVAEQMVKQHMPVIQRKTHQVGGHLMDMLLSSSNITSRREASETPVVPIVTPVVPIVTPVVPVEPVVDQLIRVQKNDTEVTVVEPLSPRTSVEWTEKHVPSTPAARSTSSFLDL